MQVRGRPCLLCRWRCNAVCRQDCMHATACRLRVVRQHSSALLEARWRGGTSQPDMHGEPRSAWHIGSGHCMTLNATTLSLSLRSRYCRIVNRGL